MKKLILSAGLAALLAATQGASFASAHHGVKAKVQVMASHAKTSGLHTHAKSVCPTTDKCKCD